MPSFPVLLQKTTWNIYMRFFTVVRKKWSNNFLWVCITTLPVFLLKCKTVLNNPFINVISYVVCQLSSIERYWNYLIKLTFLLVLNEVSVKFNEGVTIINNIKHSSIYEWCYKIKAITWCSSQTLMDNCVLKTKKSKNGNV